MSNLIKVIKKLRKFQQKKHSTNCSLESDSFDDLDLDISLQRQITKENLSKQIFEENSNDRVYEFSRIDQNYAKRVIGKLTCSLKGKSTYLQGNLKKGFYYYSRSNKWLNKVNENLFY